MNKLSALLNLASLVSDDAEQPQPSKTLASVMVGKYVIIRTYSAGVHIGILDSYAPETKDVVLHEARRIHYWEGAFTLSAIANNPTFKSNTRISEEVSEILLTNVIEIIPTTATAEKTLRGHATHKI